jgi:hypothetical protein
MGVPREGPGLAIALADPGAATPAFGAPACSCAPSRCDFTVSRVRLYLAAIRQAQIVHEDPVEILRDRCRSSRNDDPWAPHGRFDPHRARDLLLSVQEASVRTGIPLSMWSADKLAASMCPLRWNED